MDALENETNYDPSKYRTPEGAPADIVIFTITTREKNTVKKSLPIRELRVLLIRRKIWPFAGKWALPGGFSKPTETIHDCARRELHQETGVNNILVEYFNVYSEPNRDPRGWIISHAFFALVAEEHLVNRQAADDADEVRLFTIEEALELELAFDHNQILRDALQEVRYKMLTTTIAREFLAREFTISELYHVIQTVVPEFEEKNFIRKIASTQSRKKIIEEVTDRNGQLKMSNRYSQRSAQLYQFTGLDPQLSIYS